MITTGRYLHREQHGGSPSAASVPQALERMGSGGMTILAARLEVTVEQDIAVGEYMDPGGRPHRLRKRT